MAGRWRQGSLLSCWAEPMRGAAVCTPPVIFCTATHGEEAGGSQGEVLDAATQLGAHRRPRAPQPPPSKCERGGITVNAAAPQPATPPPLLLSPPALATRVYGPPLHHSRFQHSHPVSTGLHLACYTLASQAGIHGGAWAAVAAGGGSSSADRQR